MRIGIYLGKFNPREGGGFTFQDTIIRELTRQIDGTTNTFILFFDKSAPSFSPTIEAIQLEWPFVRRLFRKLKSLLGFPTSSRLQFYVERSRVDVVWFPTFDFELVEVPFVFTVWDLQHRLQPYFPEVTLDGQWESREKLFREALGKASFIVSGTEASHRELSQFYGISPNRIRKLYHPTPDLGRIETAGAKSLIPPELTGTYLFYPAQFWPHKNHIRILLAVKLLKETHGITFPVVFCGSEKGNTSYINRKVVEMGLSNQVLMLGFVSNEQLVILYKNAFALTFPSYFGPENLPPLEAFSLGCPVIAAEVDGAREQLGDAVLYFPPGDHLALAKQILALRDNPSLRGQLTEAGHARASSYTGEHYIRDVFSIFEELRLIRLCWAD